MAANFHLFHIQNRDNLHLHMHGDFDGTSAFELINLLKEQNKDYFAVFIDTNGINQLHTFGLDVFQKNLNRSVKKNRNLVFIGKYKNRFTARR